MKGDDLEGAENGVDLVLAFLLLLVHHGFLITVPKLIAKVCKPGKRPQQATDNFVPQFTLM